MVRVTWRSDVFIRNTIAAALPDLHFVYLYRPAPTFFSSASMFVTRLLRAISQKDKRRTWLKLLWNPGMA